MIFSTLGAAIIDSSGWQTCYRVWVLITLVLGVPLSLHFPTRGKTQIQVSDTPLPYISIHFPARGKTAILTCDKTNYEFQSTSPHEGRPVLSTIVQYIGEFQSTSPHEGRQQKVTIFLPVAIPRLVIIYNFSYFHIQKFHFLNFLCFKKASLLVRIPRRFHVYLPFAQLTNYSDGLFRITLFPWICLEEKHTIPDAGKTFLIRPEIPPSTSHPETKIQCDRFPVLPIHSHDRNNPVRSLLQ